MPSLEFKKLGTHDLAASPSPGPTKFVFSASENGLPSHSTFGSHALSASIANGGAATNAGSPGGPKHLTGTDASAFSVAQMKSGAMSHFDMQLAAMYQQQAAGEGASFRGPSLASMAGAQFESAMSTDAAGRKYVTIDITAKSDAEGLLHTLQTELGMINGSHYGSMVSGRIEVSKVKALGDMLDGGDLGFARVSGAQTAAGLVSSQADIAQHSLEARQDYFVSGNGVTIGLLSDSFDTGPGSMAADIASHDLPGHTFILEDVGGGSDEGRAMAQLAHDIAPGADIMFATAFTGQAGFANNIINLALNGARVIVDDVIYFFELMYQEGIIAQAVTAVAEAGVSYFSSAGNNGNEGLQQAWVDGGIENIGGFDYTMMEFAPGKNYLPITLADFEVIMLSWDEPGASAGGVGSASDLDLFLTNKSGSQVFAASAAFNEDGDPMEGLGISGGTGATYYLRVGLYSGPAPTELKIVALGNGRPVNLGTTADNFNNGTGYGHKAAAGATSVGAVRFDATPAWGLNTPDSESFTSSGPTRIWFDADGNRLAAPDDRQVDLSAVDGVNNTFFGFDYEADGWPNFFGTSAAAPNAAAVAALMIEARPGLTVQDIDNLMKASCLDMDANNGSPPGTVRPGTFDNGPDRETGAGLIQADLAVGFARTLRIENQDAVVLNGTHFSDVIVGNGNVNQINGGEGNDVIVGGIRGDFLTGGDGMDRFGYGSLFDSHGIRRDTILDLDDVNDIIDVSGVDADDFAAGNQAFTQVVAHTAGNVGELEVEYHVGGRFAGQTTIKCWTNTDDKVDLLITAVGDHSAYTNFDL
jgi:hypothetical protein